MLFLLIVGFLDVIVGYHSLLHFVGGGDGVGGAQGEPVDHHPGLFILVRERLGFIEVKVPSC